MTNLLRLASLLTAFAVTAAGAGELDPGTDTCRDCHKDEKFRVQNKKIYDYWQNWNGSSHDLAGIACVDCHGGDKTKPTLEGAHGGMLLQSNPESPYNYKNIPKTCGKCHEAVLARFQKSRHYAQLESSGRGPSCITCHGSLDSKVYSSSILERACSNCHNAKSKNHPEVIAQAKAILETLNHANGYRRGMKFYYEAQKKPRATEKLDAAYDDVILFWHEFDFKRLGPRSKDLLKELKALYIEAHKERKDK